MSTRGVDLDTYSLSLLTAKEDILNPRSSTNWAIFTYDGLTNKLKLADSGAGGVAELAEKFHISKPQYGLCKVGSGETGGPRIALISWVGQNVEEYRKTECAGHISAIKHFFKEAHAFISAEKVEDVSEEKIREELSKNQAQTPAQWVRRSSRSADKEEIVGTNYRKTNAAMEMRLINRDSFWARAEREEEERKDDEKRRAGEERRRLERERVLKEKRDAEERDRKMNEKLQMIENQRRKQAEQDEGMRRKEKSKWEYQQREHEDFMRARLKRSESIEKAAEAAALVSQRPMNPREFFRQLSSSSSQSPTSPGSSRSGKPLRRYQRSLTDTAFIFSKAEESSTSSPYSSPLVSPFSRTSPSPIFRATSPPTSPDFRSLISPTRPRGPMSPPTSPLRPAPPVSALPSVPQTNNQPGYVVEDKPKSPTQPSAPPASPTLFASLNNPSQPHPEALTASLNNTQIHPENSVFCFESAAAPKAPTSPLPERPQTNADLNTATHRHTELVSDIGYKVQAVLVEEDEEEEDENEEEKAETEPEPFSVTAELVHTEPEEQEEEEKKEGEQERDQEEEEVRLQQDAELASLEMEMVPVEMVQVEEEAIDDEEEDDQSADSKAAPEPAELLEKEEESAVIDAESICEELKHETIVKSTNGITNGDMQQQNGIERSLSQSDTELSSPELAVCFDVHSTAKENNVEEDEEHEISENGQEVLAEQQMCVRALYDYQAEDESEISFEPGDIIKDVETVDKAWWRGWSKDGRQGLFPANYVETI
ncbi:drebrin-like protein [Notolabrus celidotus]|uniref:drebrin-like protein n=1 Tax=Notolabrus celidotus TaxID=1203425 RepID=UPI00148FB41E|nr:drebrin-like protein [Notolabrus celidotus]